MKTRAGFVSNSSSSSFVCDITGAVYSGYDGNLGDFDLVQCVNGHTFETSYSKEVLNWLNDEEYISDNGECHDREAIPTEICPICNGKAKPDIIKKRILPLLNRYHISIEDLQNGC